MVCLVFRRTDIAVFSLTHFHPLCPKFLPATLRSKTLTNAQIVTAVGDATMLFVESGPQLKVCARAVCRS